MKLHGCGECTYFNTGTGATGACHRYPPRSDLHWPRVSWDDWCGELVLLAHEDRPLPPVPVDLPDHIKGIIDRAKAQVEQWRPVKTPTVKCGNCLGTGKDPVRPDRSCPLCHGLGLQREGDEA